MLLCTLCASVVGIKFGGKWVVVMRQGKGVGVAQAVHGVELAGNGAMRAGHDF